MEKITGNDTGMDMIVKMSEGNPGAINVRMQLITKTPTIDPQSCISGLGPILMLDSYNIYGSRIWMLYKDVCNENIATTIAIIRAAQLGIITKSTLNTAIDNYGKGIDVNTIISKVKEELPNFNISV
jgi:hypothetical protein